MKTTDYAGIPYPDPEDMGAVALYMQMLAEKVEAETLRERNLIALASAPPTAIWRNQVDSGTIDNTGVNNFPLGINVGDLLFYNYTIAGAPPILGENRYTMFPSPGIYHVGWSVNMVESVTPSANTLRAMRAQVYQLIPSGFQVLQDLSMEIEAAGVAGGEFFGASGLVFVSDPAVTAMMMQMTVTAATLHFVPAGTLTAWLTKIGNDNAIEVA